MEAGQRVGEVAGGQNLDQPLPSFPFLATKPQEQVAVWKSWPYLHCQSVWHRGQSKWQWVDGEPAQSWAVTAESGVSKKEHEETQVATRPTVLKRVKAAWYMQSPWVPLCHVPPFFQEAAATLVYMQSHPPHLCVPPPPPPLSAMTR